MKTTTWLELLYDLVFAAALIQLGQGLAESVSGERALGYVGLSIPLIIAWIGFTFYENRYLVSDLVQRLLVFGQLFAVGAMALLGQRRSMVRPPPSVSQPAASQFIVAAMYLRSLDSASEFRSYTVYWASVFLLGGSIWVAGAFAPPPYDVVIWGVGSAFFFMAPLTGWGACFSRCALRRTGPISLSGMGC